MIFLNNNNILVLNNMSFSRTLGFVKTEKLSLQKLKVLDISFNDHYFKAYGITHNLDFVKNLLVLEILNMSNNCIHTLTTIFLQSESLNELRFGHNELGTL